MPKVSTMQNGERLVKPPVFSGRKSNYYSWWMRSKVYATVYKFFQVLSKTRETDMPATDSTAIDTSNNQGKLEEAEKSRNDVAMENFLWHSLLIAC